MQDRGAGVLGAGTRPLQCFVLEPDIRNALVGRDHLSNLAHNVRRRSVRPVSAQGVRDLLDDLPVGKALAKGGRSRTHSLYEALDVGESPLIFSGHSRRQYHVSAARRVAEEALLDYQEVHSFEGLSDSDLVSNRQCWIGSHDI
jgi:hypothetical protein